MLKAVNAREFDMVAVPSIVWGESLTGLLSILQGLHDWLSQWLPREERILTLGKADFDEPLVPENEIGMRRFMRSAAREKARQRSGRIGCQTRAGSWARARSSAPGWSSYR